MGQGYKRMGWYVSVIVVGGKTEEEKEKATRILRFLIFLFLLPLP